MVQQAAGEGQHHLILDTSHKKLHFYRRLENDAPRFRERSCGPSRSHLRVRPAIKRLVSKQVAA